MKLVFVIALVVLVWVCYRYGYFARLLTGRAAWDEKWAEIQVPGTGL